MSILHWLFGGKQSIPVRQPTVTVGMDSDAWLEEMLELIEEKEYIREQRKRLATPRGGE